MKLITKLHASIYSVWESLPKAYLYFDNIASAKSWRNKFRKVTSGYNRNRDSKPSMPRLTKQQKKEICAYYRKLYPRLLRPVHLFHQFYYEKTGDYNLNYIPDDLWYSVIDPHFNDWTAAKYLDNKCLYMRLFPTVPQPRTVAFRMNGCWLDENYLPISVETVHSRFAAQKELVIKRATESLGGKGVYFVSGKDIATEAFRLIKDIKGDIVVQESFQQHPAMAKLNSESVNTVRVLSLLKDNQVSILSVIIRMGINGARVDNASSGGITCGVTESGRLKEIAYSAAGDRFKEHPTTHLPFDSVTIPAFDELKNLVVRLHNSFPVFRLVSWDIAIDVLGRPTLIEANLCNGELDFHQLNNGPVFGDNTERILAELVR